MAFEIATTSFEVEGVKITVRQKNGYDIAGASVLYRKLISVGTLDPNDEVAIQYASEQFVPAVLQTTQVEGGDFGFPWVTTKSSASELAAAYDEFGKRLPLATAYYNALELVEHITPGTDALSPEKKETPPPQTNEPTSESM